MSGRMDALSRAVARLVAANLVHVIVTRNLNLQGRTQSARVRNSGVFRTVSGFVKEWQPFIARYVRSARAVENAYYEHFPRSRNKKG